MKERGGFNNLLKEPVRALAAAAKASKATPDEIGRRWQRSGTREIAAMKTRAYLEKNIGSGTFLGSMVIGAIMEIFFSNPED